MVALKTFDNLSENRKQEIITAALKEFVLADYQTASLSRIIKSLDLAKGSFYRYFKNKSTLYFYLLDYCINARWKHDEVFIEQEPDDFFDLILLHIKAKIKFDKTQPLASAFLYRVLQERNSEELGNIQSISKQKAIEIVKKIVKTHIEKGDIRNDLDEDLIAWHIIQTQVSLFEYIEIHFNQDFNKNLKELNQLYIIPDEDIIKLAEQFVDIQKNGIGAYVSNSSK